MKLSFLFWPGHLGLGSYCPVFFTDLAFRVYFILIRKHFKHAEDTENDMKIVICHFHPGFILSLYINVSVSPTQYCFMGLKIHIHGITLCLLATSFFSLNIRFWDGSIETAGLWVSVFLIGSSQLAFLPSLPKLIVDHLSPLSRHPSSSILTAI